MKKLISAAEAAGMVKDGMTVMIGGFLGNGSPHAIIDALVESGVKDLTLIVNDTAYPAAPPRWTWPRNRPSGSRAPPKRGPESNRNRNGGW